MSFSSVSQSCFLFHFKIHSGGYLTPMVTSSQDLLVFFLRFAVHTTLLRNVKLYSSSKEAITMTPTMFYRRRKRRL